VVDKKWPGHEEEATWSRPPSLPGHDIGPAANAISLDAYFAPHLPACTAELTDSSRANAAETVRRVNALLERMERDGVRLDRRIRPSGINSGWRPAKYNATIQGSAPNSRHITAEACDLADPDEALDTWCLRNIAVLEEIGLWLENPAVTRGWCHVQIVPSRYTSKRIFGAARKPG